MDTRRHECCRGPSVRVETHDGQLMNRSGPSPSQNGSVLVLYCGLNKLSQTWPLETPQVDLLGVLWVRIPTWESLG